MLGLAHRLHRSHCFRETLLVRALQQSFCRRFSSSLGSSSSANV
jgi:hypothetical protein